MFTIISGNSQEKLNSGIFILHQLYHCLKITCSPLEHNVVQIRFTHTFSEMYLWYRVRCIWIIKSIERRKAIKCEVACKSYYRTMGYIWNSESGLLTSTLPLGVDTASPQNHLFLVSSDPLQVVLSHSTLATHLKSIHITVLVLGYLFSH